MTALCNRVAFTDMVEKALVAGSGLGSVQAELTSKREMLIIAGRETLPKSTRQQLSSLQTLVKEQLDVVADLMAAPDAKAAWKDEFRYYPQPDGTIRCKCCDYDVLVGNHFPAYDMLVVTPLTRQARRSYMEAMSQKKGLAFLGPAGTGKTETIKDTARMLGFDVIVVNCDEKMDSLPADISSLLQQLGPNAPVVFDEFNRLTAANMEKVFAAKGDNFFCYTLNPGYAGRTEVPASLKAQCVELPFTVPDMKLIVSVMLGAEGFTKCDDLSPKVLAVMDACKDKCTKQNWYDFGLRCIKATCRYAGQTGAANRFADENEACSSGMVRSLYARSTAADRDVVKAEVKAAFGLQADPPLPAGYTSGLEGTAAMVADLARVRHGLCIIGAADVDACVAAINKAMGSESITVTGDAAGIHAGGDDSPFASAMKAAAAKKGAVNVIVKGPLPAEALEGFNTLHDDNKVYITTSGTRLPLTANMRVVVFDDCKLWSPASTSRVACVVA